MSDSLSHIQLITRPNKRHIRGYKAKLDASSYDIKWSKAYESRHYFEAYELDTASKLTSYTFLLSTPNKKYIKENPMYYT